MIAKFSVKKPFTVMVGVVLVLILGFVSFTRMTPDLLPSINLPYALVMTTYVGATPEKVEATVTKPIEQSMATLSGISSIQSVSSENVSMVILEFQEDVNMDTKTVEMREKLDTLSGAWDDMVGTPSIMKINPDMLPVVVAAVSVEGMDSEEISDFLDKNIIPRLEGTEGVASVSASGKISTQLNVLLSQKKIDEVNRKIQKAVTDQLDGHIKDLEDARAELADTRRQLEEANAAYAAGVSQASDGFAAARMEILSGEMTISAAEEEIAKQEAELYKQMAAFTGVTYSDLDSLEKALVDLQGSLAGQEEQLASAEEAITLVETQMNQLFEAVLKPYVDENGNLVFPDGSEETSGEEESTAEEPESTSEEPESTPEEPESTAGEAESTAGESESTSEEPESTASEVESQNQSEPESTASEVEIQNPSEPESTAGEVESQSPLEPESTAGEVESQSPSEPESTAGEVESQSPSEPESTAGEVESQSPSEPESTAGEVESQSPSEPESTADERESQSALEPESTAEEMTLEPESSVIYHRTTGNFASRAFLAEGDTPETRAADEANATETRAADDANEPGEAGETTVVSYDELYEAFQKWQDYILQKEQIATAREQLETAKEGLPKALEGIRALKAAKAELAAAREQLEIGKAYLDEQERAATSEMNAAGAQISEGLAQVGSGESQIGQAIEELNGARSDALKQANISGVITMDMISQILSAQNFAMPAGYVEEEGVNWLIRVGDKLKGEEELKNLFLFDMGIEGADPIYLADVADVFYSNNAAEIYAKINGTNGVLLSMNKQSNYSTAEVSDNVSDTFKTLEKAFPGTRFTMLSDQGDYIDLVVNTVLQNLMYGAVLAILVLILFLKDMKPTLVIACSIPISVVFAFVLMYFSNITLNVISLSGLAIGVGMLVDNSVVVIENIYRLRNKGVPAAQAAVSGTVQVAGSITASTLTTVCVFLPIVFIEGLTRELFTDMALTIAYSLFASLIVAMTLVPAMAAGLLKDTKEKPHRIFDFFMKGYRVVLNGCLNHKAFTLMVAVLFLVVSVMGSVQKGTAFMPAMDSTQISVTVTMPEGAEWEDTVETADLVCERILKLDGVETVGALVGGGSLLNRSGGSNDSVTVYVILREDKTESSQQIATRINHLFDDVAAEVRASGSASMDMSSLTGSGVSIRVSGNDLDDLRNTAQRLADQLAKVEGIAEVSSGIEDPTPELRITINKNEAMKQGLTVAQAYMSLAEALSTSKTATTLTENQNEYSVIITDEKRTEMSLEDIRNYVFKVTDRTGAEKEIPLKDVATVMETEALSSISRYEQNRYLTVSGTLAEGYNVGLVSGDVERAIRDVEIPDGIKTEFTGENETINEAFEQLGQMLALALAFIYLIMVAQFQSLKSPFIVMFTIPLAFTGGFLALWIADMEVSVIALLGLIMLSGIVVNNGIVLVDFVNQLRAEGTPKREALLEAGVTRMRPILMTAITTILGLTTMAIGVGMGSELMQPIAVVTIGGLTYATFMTLFVVPVLYDLMNKKELHVLTDAELEVVDL